MEEEVEVGIWPTYKLWHGNLCITASKWGEPKGRWSGGSQGGSAPLTPSLPPGLTLMPICHADAECLVCCAMLKARIQPLNSLITPRVDSDADMSFRLSCWVCCARLKGWMTDWHVQHNFTNPVHLNHFLPHGQRSVITYLLTSLPCTGLGAL